MLLGAHRMKIAAETLLRMALLNCCFFRTQPYCIVFVLCILQTLLLYLKAEFQPDMKPGFGNQACPRLLTLSALFPANGVIKWLFSSYRACIHGALPRASYSLLVLQSFWCAK